MITYNPLTATNREKSRIYALTDIMQRLDYIEEVIRREAPTATSLSPGTPNTPLPLYFQHPENKEILCRYEVHFLCLGTAFAIVSMYAWWMLVSPGTPRLFLDVVGTTFAQLTIVFILWLLNVSPVTTIIPSSGIHQLHSLHLHYICSTPFTSSHML